MITGALIGFIVGVMWIVAENKEPIWLTKPNVVLLEGLFSACVGGLIGGLF